MKFLKISSLWLLCYFFPQYAGSWYDEAFPVYQALISALVLFVSLRISREWWVLFLADLCCIQILFHAGDALFNIQPSHYNHMLNTLNGIEAFIVFGCGGIAQVCRIIRNGIGNRNRDPNLRCVSTASGLPGKKNGI